MRKLLEIDNYVVAVIEYCKKKLMNAYLKGNSADNFNNLFEKMSIVLYIIQLTSNQ